jgi:NADH:ubiquinone reductase (non-electrogenic)
MPWLRSETSNPGSLLRSPQRPAPFVSDVNFFLKSSGFWTWWMYGAVYLSKQFSLRNRWLVANDWVKRFLFGRDISRF